MAVIEISKIQVRRGQENQTGIPTLAGGEFGWAADTENLYIGLRREDGGARDANVRILTENDLIVSNIFDTPAIQDYTYRSDTEPPITADPNTGLAVVRDINKKLDDFVSIRDFGIIGQGGDANESELIQNAIDRLFLDPLKTTNNYGTYTAKTLYFPSGVYNIDQPILVPAYTTIVGDGIGKTIINLTSTSSHAIQTIDADVNDIYTERVTFDTENMSSGPGQPNYIHIEKLTIQYSTSTGVTGCLPLVSLDCSENATFRDVKFAGNHSVGDNIDIGHSGISIRGYAGAENLTVSSNNTLVDNCEFNGLYHCVISNFDIVNSVIQNSQLYNSVRGITFNDEVDAGATTGPRGARILNNRFVKIDQQAIYVGYSAGGYTTDNVSMNNRFYNVGNFGYGRTSTTGTSVITLGDSDVSINDWFDRQEYQNQNLGNSLVNYKSLVDGRAVINNLAVKTFVLSPGNNILFRLPITGLSQHLTIDYNLTQGVPGNYTIDRIGKLNVYIQPGDTPNNTNIVDDYTYILGEGSITWSLTVNPVSTFYEFNALTLLEDITLEYQTNLMI